MIYDKQRHRKLRKYCAGSCNFSIDSFKFLTKEIMSARNFNFVLILIFCINFNFAFKHERFLVPNYVFLNEENFPTVWAGNCCSFACSFCYDSDDENTCWFVGLEQMTGSDAGRRLYLVPTLPRNRPATAIRASAAIINDCSKNRACTSLSLVRRIRRRCSL